jgi:hypothetical protein
MAAMTMSRRDSARRRAPADRHVGVIARVAIYRQIGRRPSQVYVDDTMRPAAAGAPARRLSDNVFWRTYAEVGDHIEERAGGLLLMTEAMACHPIQLSVPQPLEVASAFGHADAVLREDRKILEDLLAIGSVTEISARPSKVLSSRLPDTLFAEGHPLVVTIPPDQLDGDHPASPVQRGADSGPAKHSPAPR